MSRCHSMTLMAFDHGGVVAGGGAALAAAMERALRDALGAE